MAKPGTASVPLSARRQHFQLTTAEDALIRALATQFQHSKPKPSPLTLRLLAQQITAANPHADLKKPQQIKALAKIGHRMLVPFPYDLLQETILPAYNAMKDLDKTAQRLANAVLKGEQIGISGDYDCDGNCSTALMVRFLTESGVAPQHLHVHIPNRAKEGYGINTAAVEAMAKQTPPVTLLITLDNGTTATQPIADAKNKRMDVAVIDHHPNSEGHPVPQGAKIVNPRQSEETPAIKHDPNGAPDLAAVGVTWLVARRAAEILQAQGYYTQKNISPPNPRTWLGLVAMATIGDVVSIQKPLNHALVSEGLAVIREDSDPYISTLARAAGLRDPAIAKLSESDIAFKLAPIINAPGRLGQSVAWAFLSPAEGMAEPAMAQLEADISASGTNLKTALKKNQPSIKPHPEKQSDTVSDNQYRLMILSDEANELRKKVAAEVTRQARTQANAWLADNPARGTLVLDGDDWHEGVIGIVAGRIKEEFGLPTIVVSNDREKGKCKASARNILGHNGDLGQALRDMCEKQGILSKAGGHPMAAGASFDLGKLEEVRRAFEAHMGDLTRATRAAYHPPIAAAINLGKALGAGRNAQPPMQALEAFAAAQEGLRPYGQGREKPRVALYGGVVQSVRSSSGDQHITFTLGLPGTTDAIRGRAFHIGGSAQQHLLQAAQSPRNDQLPLLIGTLEHTTHDGKPAIEFFLEDILTLPHQPLAEPEATVARALNTHKSSVSTVLHTHHHGR